MEREALAVVGVGDMSGDVFGNGMLLSEQIALVAAFDHRDIFIDPAPGSGAFAERKRLFALPRSSWQDFDKSRISKGGGVFSRQSKSIALTDEMRKLLNLDAHSLAPNELIRAVLKCRTDLLWFGGIGTYIRAGSESDAEAGDRANDAVRITAAEVGAKVIGEGANLAVTQRARIEFAARGGRINADFIDNSAGVNTSDQEVNIKIALGDAMRSGKLTRAARNKLLAAMTDDVAAASLVNNYQQSLALSLAERNSARELADYALLMASLETRKLFARPLEALPSDGELQDRARAGRGLTRPELAVLLSYAKIALQHDLLESELPDVAQLSAWLTDYFPPALRGRFAEELENHRLRREIIALGLTNAIVDRGGPTMVVRLANETGRTAANIALAFVAARDIFALAPLWQRIDALDGKLKGSSQLALYAASEDLVRAQTAWFLLNGDVLGDLAGTIDRHRAGFAALQPAVAAILPERGKLRLEREMRRLLEGGIPAELAADVAALDVLKFAPPITLIAEETGRPISAAAATYLAVGEQLRIAELSAKATAMAAPDHYDRLAIAQALTQLADAQATFTRRVLASCRGEANGSAVAAWLSRQGVPFDRVRHTLEEVAGKSPLSLARLLVAAGQLGELSGARAVALAP